MDKISVVILSGGKSSRMGTDKAQLLLDGKTFVEHISYNLSEADELLFSVRDKAQFPDVVHPHVEDEYPGCGPLSGIHAALGVCRNPWLFVIACDIPLVTWEVVKKLYEYVDNHVQAVIPMETDGRFHAVCGLYHKSMRKKIELQLEKKCYKVREALKNSNIIYVPVYEFADHENIFQNINTLEGYLSLKHKSSEQ